MKCIIVNRESSNVKISEIDTAETT